MLPSQSDEQEDATGEVSLLKSLGRGLHEL
jgi:hypothetical protein